MIIFYPTSTFIYSRQVTNSNLTELFLAVPPNAILFLTGSSFLTASVVSASYCATSSVSLNAQGGSNITASALHLYNTSSQQIDNITVDGLSGNESLFISQL